MKKRTIVEICIVVIVIAIAAYAFYDFNGKSFDLSDRQPLLIVTDSMDGDVKEYEIDSFPQDTLIMVKHLSDSEKMQIQIGDVLSFRYGAILDHHRVIELHLDQGYVVTKGDNTEKYHSQETVYLNDINGKVIGTNHLFGAAATFVKDHFLIVIAVIAIFAIIGEVVRAYKNGVFDKEEGQ